jgi:putative sugar O-methyltransferase
MTWDIEKGTEARYLALCKEASENDEVFKTFKQHPAYTPILEHVTPALGYEFIKQTDRRFFEEDAFKMNDSIGGAVTVEYEEGTYSPSTLRYMKVASDILNGFRQLPYTIDVVEVGGGYGGQALALDTALGIHKYTIVDQPEVIALAKRYLDHFTIEALTDFMPSDGYTPTKCDLFISNYALSELTWDEQEEYYVSFIADAKRVYVTYNAITPEAKWNQAQFHGLLSQNFEVRLLNDIDDGFENVIMMGERK